MGDGALLPPALPVIVFGLGVFARKMRFGYREG